MVALPAKSGVSATRIAPSVSATLLNCFPCSQGVEIDQETSLVGEAFAAHDPLSHMHHEGACHSRDSGASCSKTGIFSSSSIVIGTRLREQKHHVLPEKQSKVRAIHRRLKHMSVTDNEASYMPTLNSTGEFAAITPGTAFPARRTMTCCVAGLRTSWIPACQMIFFLGYEEPPQD